MEQGKASSSSQLENSKPPVRVVLALIGTSFTHNFLGCIMNLIDQFSRSKDYVVTVNQGAEPSPLLSRVASLTIKQFDKKPFESSDYDVMVMLDHNILFTPKQVFDLIDTCVQSHPVVFTYHRSGTSEFSNVVKEWTENSSMKPCSLDTIKGWAKEHEGDDVCMPISHASFGLFAARKEALDSLEYPYFQFPLASLKSEDGKETQEFVSEDIVFCLKMKEAGFAPVVKTDIMVAKEMSVIA